MRRAAAFDQGEFPTIGVVNLATVDLGLPKGITFAKFIAALRKAHKQFTKIWGYPVKLVIYPSLDKIPKDAWQFLLLDDADAAGALGYHDLTENGQPVSKTFVKTTIEDGEKVSVTASHELFEMTIDPGAQLWAQKDDKTIVAYEMSDAVEENTFLVDGVEISNFVHPAYFENWEHPPGTKFDHLGVLTRPFELAQGGYEINARISNVDQAFGSQGKARRFAKENRLGHRSEYRKPIGQVIT